MDFNKSQALIIILALILGGQALRQLTRSKRRRDRESTSGTDDASGEENEVLRGDSESTSEDESGEENKALRDSESTSRTGDKSGKENEALERDSEPTSRRDNALGEENEALRWDSESTTRKEDVSGKTYDVFLSFRGSDTRLNFTDYLYRSMVNEGIRVFLDSEELELGQEISELFKAVKESQIYIPIFSKNFASSKWCLREVERMVHYYSKSNEKKVILPIFYDVSTNDVKLRTDLYEHAILGHKKSSTDKLEQWRNALIKVGGFYGKELQGKRQGEEIESIVREVSCKLKIRQRTVTEHLVEDTAQLQALMKLLDIDSDGVRFIVIHGMGGIGKTTLATVLYNKLCSYFQSCSFLKDVRASWQTPGGPLGLQKKLITDFVGSRIADQFTDVHGGINMIERVFNDKKVLVVLDDLDTMEQLKTLAKQSNWFGLGSRILITTRNESILKTQQKSSSEDVLHQPNGVFHYDMHEMEFDHALRLFRKHAFIGDSTIEAYDDLAEKLVHKVRMLPLAVEVIGSHLYNRGIVLKQYSDKIKLWEGTLKQLDEGPFKDVRDALMISLVRLENNQKEVFLDIACFFTGEDKAYPLIMWDDYNYCAVKAISDLLLLSLIKIGEDEKFWMHDQVRDLGRYIIFKEDPHKFSRAWNHKDAVNLLERKERNQNVEALSLIPDGCSRNIALKELAALPNLRFLRVKGIDIFGNSKNFLWILRWPFLQMWQTIFRVDNFRNLVMLDLSNSDIEDGWGGWSQMKVIGKLKVLDLSGCKKLTRTPNFSNFTSLEMLILAWCPKLITIDRSISKLELLKTLNIKGCSSLGDLPEEVGSLHSLTEIVMPQNFQPLKLPERFGELKSLSSFKLDEHPRTSKLPKSIGGLVNLTHLSLRGCVGIKKLPSSIGQLQRLVELNVMKTGIIKLPNSIGNLKKLRVMNISYTLITEFPRTIGGVKMLEELYAKKCWCLTENHLREIGKLSNLKILDLSYTYISSLPREIGRLPRLETLQVGSIELLQLTALPSSLTRLEVQAIDFSIITEFSSLVHLQYLELYRLSTFLRKEPYSTWRNDTEKMEEAFRKKQPIHRLPPSLSTLKLKGISPLPYFSNIKRLTVLRVSEFPLSCLRSFESLSNLRELKISRCDQLKQIPDLSHLEKLQSLVLNSLKGLVNIPGLSELKSLKDLRLSRCPLIKKLPNLSKLDKLQHLEVGSCPKLRPIEGVKGLKNWKLDSPGRTVLERLLYGSRTTWICHNLPMYDVFLSFKGSDTRYSIVKFLRDSLSSARASVFRDDDELSPGEGIGEEIQQALENSRIYVPIFSRQYADSQWCLRELEQMVKYTSESESKDERKILPIFYDVNIDDVKLKSKLYREVLEEHREDFPDEVNAWEEALKKVGNMEGFGLNTTSFEDMAQKIIAEVLRTKKLLDVDS